MHEVGRSSRYFRLSSSARLLTYSSTLRARALLALDGLSVGDALGERFFMPAPRALRLIQEGRVLDAPWHWTYDTQMAISVVETLFEALLAHTPAGQTRDGLVQAAAIGPDADLGIVAERLGSGQDVSAQDTVPFALWCAAGHLDSFEETFWATVRGLGDRDTTCAIACGVVALSVGEVPLGWLEAREPLRLGFA